MAVRPPKYELQFSDVRLAKTTDRLLTRLGLDLLEVVSERRGAATMKVAGVGGAQSIFKLVAEDNGTVLRELMAHRVYADVTGGQLIGSGHGDGMHWLHLKMQTGISAVERASRIRALPAGCQTRAFAEFFAGIAGAFQRLHGAGLLHGDVQPGHIFTDGSKVSLIDWGSAVQVNDPDASYQGALVHYASPEVAAGMLARSGRIPYDVPSEIYSIGATMFFLLTEKTVTRSGELPPGDLDARLRAVIEGCREVSCIPNEKLMQIIQCSTSAVQQERFQTAAALRKALLSTTHVAKL